MARPRAPKKPITESIVLRMAELLTNRLTDKEACAVLGIRQDSWSEWLGKRQGNSEKFTQTFSRVKGNLIDHCLDGMRRAGAKDWRALDALLKRLDPDRFGDRIPQAPTQVSVSVFAGSDYKAIGARVYGEAKQVEDARPKLLEDKSLVVSEIQPVVGPKEL